MKKTAARDVKIAILALVATVLTTLYYAKQGGWREFLPSSEPGVIGLLLLGVMIASKTSRKMMSENWESAMRMAIGILMMMPLLKMTGKGEGTFPDFLDVVGKVILAFLGMVTTQINLKKIMKEAAREAQEELRREQEERERMKRYPYPAS